MTRPSIRAAFLAVALIAAAVANPRAAVAQTGKDALTPAQREAVEAIVGDVLRNNPEIVLEAIRTLQERQRAAELEKGRDAVARHKDAIENDPSSPVAGNPNGSVTVVEFFDYRCTYCKQVLPTITALIHEDADVRYVFKEFPILSPESEIAARVALLVWQYHPDKYFTFHRQLMSVRGNLDKARVLRIAEDLGADAARIEREMESEELGAILERNRALAQELGIRGTPGFVIDDTIVPGAVGLEALKRLVADARKG
jgi:protein-disulfide isomerase